MPYIFAKALVDGTITVAAFEKSAYRDQALRPLMSKIRIHIDDEVNAAYPATVSMKLTATTKDGRTVTLSPRDPLGHTNNPMKDDDVRAKFLQIVEPVLGKERASDALERWWRIRQASPSEVTDALTLLDLKTEDTRGSE